ncbi:MULTISPECIES: DUF2065 domain-containing protein [Hyphomicrobiales]|uniref:DUF2065 domain-containing protein n=1 Tax=Hyphomicrobiales TaxID=356 RepID=UPI0003735D78|nr:MULTISPECIES: DUF2065 domain-containing protein [Phyllobacteriaceae]MCX8571345.1 DUF2065 domain-containing protein [Aminobacter sp. MET-1]
MQDLIVAIGLVLVIEGVVYGGFPAQMKRLAAQMADIPDNALRLFGLVAIAIGVGIVWLIRG